jgi:type II secretory pathway pseudopilin PulG
MKNIKSQRGFILLAAIIACAILAALGILVLSLSTGDLRTSAATLGEKRALGAVESGFHLLTQYFSIDPQYQSDCHLTGTQAWKSLYPYDPVNAPGAQYIISGCTPDHIFPPVPPPGYSLDTAAGIGMGRYNLQLTGKDTTYNSEISVGLGITGPPELGGGALTPYR